MNTTGIDAIAFYVPKLYVSMDNLSTARGISAEKLKRGLGLEKMAVPNTDEDAVTFAANALLNLINQNNINPNDIGRVYLGTESAVDGSKPTATYAVEIVEQELIKEYGERSFKHCDILDMTFACVGAVDALHNTLDWVNQDKNRKAIVIASDLSKYDYILLDCPPSLNVLTVNALIAAHALIIPLQSEFFALEGLSQLLMSVREVRDLGNPDLRIEGVVLTMYDARNRLSLQVEEDARENLGELIFKTVIPRNVRISEAPSFAMPVLSYDSRSKGAEAYRALAQEILARR